MAETQAEYYRRRAAQELDLARQAAHPLAARAHLEMAGHYLDRTEAAPPAAQGKPAT